MFAATVRPYLPWTREPEWFINCNTPGSSINRGPDVDDIVLQKWTKKQPSFLIRVGPLFTDIPISACAAQEKLVLVMCGWAFPKVMAPLKEVYGR